MKRFVLGATLALALSMVGAAYAERYVVVNGQRLSQGEILHLEQWHCGPIPNGHYWLNLRSGIWDMGETQGHRAILRITVIDVSAARAYPNVECSFIQESWRDSIVFSLVEAGCREFSRY